LVKDNKFVSFLLSASIFTSFKKSLKIPKG